MKTRLSIALPAAFVVLVCANSDAEITSLVNYQSKLKRNGTNEHGQINAIFRVYTGETNDICVYQEAQQVQVKEGLLSTLIGKNPSLGDIGEACQLDDAYLEVEINGTKLKPRERFCPPPFAKKSEVVWNIFSSSGYDRDGDVQMSDPLVHVAKEAKAFVPPDLNTVKLALFPMPGRGSSGDQAQDKSVFFGKRRLPRSPSAIYSWSKDAFVTLGSEQYYSSKSIH